MCMYVRFCVCVYVCVCVCVCVCRCVCHTISSQRGEDGGVLPHGPSLPDLLTKPVEKQIKFQGSVRWLRYLLSLQTLFCLKTFDFCRSLLP
jgi:hypothetical protein